MKLFYRTYFRMPCQIPSTYLVHTGCCKRPLTAYRRYNTKDHFSRVVIYLNCLNLCMFGQTLDVSFIYFHPTLPCLSLAYIYVNLISYFREKITVRTRPKDIDEQSSDIPLFGNTDIIIISNHKTFWVFNTGIYK